MRLKPEASPKVAAGSPSGTQSKVARLGSNQDHSVLKKPDTKTGEPKTGPSGFFIRQPLPNTRVQGSSQRSLESLAAKLDLPKDAATALLLMNFQHFSLPFSPEALQRVRYRLRDSKTSKALAVNVAVAAEAKGIALSPEALLDIVSLLDPESAYPEEGQDPKGSNNRNRQADTPDHPRDSDQEAPDDDSRGPSISDLRHAQEEADRTCKVLGLMNRLQGRERTRWIAFPFSFTHMGVEFKVSVRLLLQDEELPCQKLLALAVEAVGKERRWSISMQNPGESDSAATIRVFPLLGKHLEAEYLDRARKAFGGLAGCVRMGKGSEEDQLQDWAQAITAEVEEEA